MLPGCCWDAELVQGHVGAPLGLLLCRAPAPGVHGCFLHPRSTSAVMCPRCFYRVGRVWGALTGSLTLLLVSELGRPWGKSQER